MIDPLSQKDQESVFILRNKYSIIRVIGIVERYRQCREILR